MNLLDQLPCAVVVTDATGRLLDANAELLSLVGGSRASRIGSSIEDVLPPASRIFLQTHVWPTLLRDGRIQEIHMQVIGSDHARVPVLLNSRLGNHLHEPAYFWTVFIARDRHRFEAELVEQRNLAESTSRALDESQRFIRGITDAIPGMVAYWDKDLRCRFANKAYVEWFGRQPEALVGTTLQQLLGERLFELNVPHARAALAGQEQQFERELTKADGTLGHTWAHYVPDLSDGEVRGFFVKVSDVTALKSTQLALEEAQRLGQTGSWTWQVDGDRVGWSAQMFSILGVDPQGGPPSFTEQARIYDPESYAALGDRVALALQTGEPYALELRYRRPGGQSGWVEARGEVLRDPAGRVCGLRGTVQEITQRRAQQHALELAQDRLRAMYETTPAMLHSIDSQGQLLHVSDAWLACMGYRRDEVIGRLSSDFLTEESRRRAREEVLPAFIKEGRCDEVPYQMVTSRGEIIDVLLSALLERDELGQPGRSLAVIMDVTLRRRAERELAQQYELMRVTLQSIGDAVITTDAYGAVDWLNPVAERMTGWLTTEAKGLPLSQVFHIVNEETRAPTENPVATCLAQGKIVGLANHTLLISRDGTEFGIEDSAAPIRNAAGDILGVVLVFHDVSEQRRLSGEMTYRATHDALTGLVNRAEFETRLLRTLHQAHGNDSHHALLYIDLDQFKLVNDACGHAIGDQLLQQVSKLLADTIRGRDTLARMGGDEFAIILEHCTTDQANRVAQKICDRMDDFRFVHENRRFRIGTSIGLVPVDKRWASTAAVQQAADTSCYAAKEAGRNRVHAWFDTDAAMRARHHEVQWTSRMEQALDQEGFVLFAQRIQSLKEVPKGLHAEVLLRMRNEDGSLALPGAFLPAAERFHLVSRIDRWVLRHAIDWLRSLPSEDLVESLSVNLSGQSVGDRAFHAWAVELFNAAGDSICSRLCLEITETAAVTNLADAAIFIGQVREAGVKVALDDFGAGASSFGYLKNLSVDYLKIDGQFIRDLLSDSLDDAAVRCFADVAKLMGLKTVAEFVDNAEVLERLRVIGVDFAQGYLIHRPEPIGSLIEIESRSTV